MLLDKFITEIKSKERSKATLELFSHTLVKSERILNKPLEDAGYEDLQAYLEHIKVNGLKENGKGKKDIIDGWKLSKSSLWTVENHLIQFYTFCFNETDDPKYHKIIKKLKSIKVDKPKNELRPQDIPMPDEVKRLINVATLERDRALVASFYEGGLRIGEMMALDNDKVEMNEHNQEVTFHIPEQEGCKTGARSVLCLEIYGYVQDWLKCNPSNKFMDLSENGIRGILEKLYRLAKIDKPCNPHMLRHASITNACIMKMQPNQISMRYWGIPNSNMLSVYLHLSDQIVNSGYRDAKGMGNGNGNTVINPLASRCVNCGKLIQSGTLCKTCEDSKKLSETNAALQARLDEQERKMEAFLKLIQAQQQTA